MSFPFIPIIKPIYVFGFLTLFKRGKINKMRKKQVSKSSIPLTGKIFYEGFIENERERYCFTESLELALKEQQRMLDADVKVDIVELRETIYGPPLLTKRWFIDDNNKVDCTQDWED